MLDQLFDELQTLHSVKAHSYGLPGRPLANYEAAAAFAGTQTVVAMGARLAEKVTRLGSFSRAYDEQFERGVPLVLVSLMLEELKDISLIAALAAVHLQEEFHMPQQEFKAQPGAEPVVFNVVGAAVVGDGE